jgi:hypothetical protein
MFRETAYRQRLQKSGYLAALLVPMLISAPSRAAQCMTERQSGSPEVTNHAVVGRAGILSSLDFSDLAAMQRSCRKNNATQPVESRRASSPMVTAFSTANENAGFARAQPDPRMESAARIASEMASTIAPRFDMHWRNSVGPEFVRNIPEWVTTDAKNYHRRGLPLVHLWESSNYLVALGLSNHGVPGVYFSQKLP